MGACYSKGNLILTKVFELIDLGNETLDTTLV
jgi:hypothetical protein